MDSDELLHKNSPLNNCGNAWGNVCVQKVVKGNREKKNHLSSGLYRSHYFSFIFSLPLNFKEVYHLSVKGQHNIHL